MKANQTVIANLQTSASLECGLHLQLHLDVRMLKDRELRDFAGKVDGWGEDSECILKRISKRLIKLRVDPQYEGGFPKAITASMTALFENELAMEQSIYDQYQEFCTQARSVGDEISAHDWKDYLAIHEHRIFWLERKLRQIAAFGENEYALESLG